MHGRTDAPWTKRMTHLAKDGRALLAPSVYALLAHRRHCAPQWIAPLSVWASLGEALRPEDMSAALRTCFSANGQRCTAAIAEFIQGSGSSLWC